MQHEFIMDSFGLPGKVPIGCAKNYPAVLGRSQV
jgi:hypothetical protein